MKTSDITDLEGALLVKVPNTKTKKPRSFTITGEQYLNFYRKYASLRPADMNTNRFFIKYQNGKCHRQVVGIHKLTSTAQEVATYLGLPDLKLYTGHCLRRTSATLLMNAGADISALKRHGGWQSTSIAESYIAESSQPISNRNLPPVVLQSLT
uniref:Tyr recombinase domain-containing protein n=1 Tax=Photinus pyralis TaxID=7054 RepID=A0A1Y1NJ05_PHOPY